MTARNFYDGETLHVRCYDSMHDGNHPAVAGDIAFYKALGDRTGGPVLEVGTGTGRVAVRLAEAGFSVTGLDLSSDMLALATQKAAMAGCRERISLVQGDMRNFSLGAGSFGLVIVPYRAFQVLLTPDDQRAALTAFRHHLRSDGILALHLFDPNLHFLLPGAELPTLSGVDPLTNQRVEAAAAKSEFDYVAQVRRDQWHYEAFAADGSVVEEQTLELALRWTWRWEIGHLLELAGFTVEQCHSDFHRSPPAYAKEQIFVCRLAA